MKKWIFGLIGIVFLLFSVRAMAQYIPTQTDLQNVQSYISSNSVNAIADLASKRPGIIRLISILYQQEMESNMSYLVTQYQSIHTSILSQQAQQAILVNEIQTLNAQLNSTNSVTNGT